MFQTIGQKITCLQGQHVIADLIQKKDALTKNLISELTLDKHSIQSFMQWLEDQDRTSNASEIDWTLYGDHNKYDTEELMLYWIQWRQASRSDRTVINTAYAPKPENTATIQQLLLKANGINEQTIMAFVQYQNTQPHAFPLLDKWVSFKRSRSMECVAKAIGLPIGTLTQSEFDAFLKTTELNQAELLSPTNDSLNKIRQEWAAFAVTRGKTDTARIKSERLPHSSHGLSFSKVPRLEQPCINAKCTESVPTNVQNSIPFQNNNEHPLDDFLKRLCSLICIPKIP